MKIRWTNGSARFRITPSEMEYLLAGREVTEELAVPGGAWRATLAAGEATSIGMDSSGGGLRVTLSEADRACLAVPDAEGVYLRAGDELRYYVEKDFPCAHPRPPAAQEPTTETFAPPPGFKERHRTC